MRDLCLFTYAVVRTWMILMYLITLYFDESHVEGVVIVKTYDKHDVIGLEKR